MKLGRDGIAGLILLGISLFLLPLTYTMPKLPIVPIGPGFYPAIVLVLMAALSGLLVVQDIFAQRRAPAAEAPAGPRRAYDLVAAAFAVTGAYVALLPYLGFRVATVLFVAAFQLVLERPRTALQWAVLAAVAAGTMVVTYIVFEHYLTVLLPRGTWTGW